MSATDEAELASLRARVQELEDELARTRAWASREVAAAQERLYWLDRWGVDLNTVMAHPLAPRLRAGYRAVRRPARAIRRWKWRLLG